MQNFTFQNPTKLIFGKGTMAQLGTELKAGGVRKVLLVAGGGSIKANGVYKQVTASLKAAKVAWTEAWGVQANPVLSKCYDMIALARKEKVDAILAVGGGSVVDSAKTVAAGVYMKDVWLAFEGQTPLEKALPLYVVLTISATGSEMNGYAVVTKAEEKKKWAFGGLPLYPKVSIVDPAAQMSLPWQQTVNGALDATAHIHEYYFTALAGADAALTLDEGLLTAIVRATDQLQSRPKDYAARASLALAATLALNGVSAMGIGGGDWACHGIEHGVSAVCPDVAHGAGLGVICPAWILYCEKANPAVFRRWAQNVWGARTVAAGVKAFRAKVKAWGGQTKLRELGVRREQLDEIAANAAAVGMNGSVKKLTVKDIRKILDMAY